MHNESTAIFNLGHNETMNVIDLAKIVCDEMNLEKIQFEFTGGIRGWIGDSPYVHLDTTKAREFGWIPKIKIEEGIRETVRYLISEDSRRFR